MAFPWGSLITAGSSLLGGLLDDSDEQAEKANRQQVRAIRKANKRAEEREDNRIQRVAEDARAAGIHPLAALGSPVVGTFATPTAAFGGAPISGSAVGDAIANAGAAIGSGVDSVMRGSYEKRLQEAQLRNLEASTQNLLAEARSRTTIAQAQLGGQSLGSGNDVGAWTVFPRKPGAAQKAQDDFGDIWEQLFGTANIGAIQAKPEQMGPLSREFWRYWLGEDYRYDN